MLRLRTTVRVRALRADDLRALAKASPARPLSKHRERLEQQAEGRLAYLGGWLGSEAAGHVMVVWPDPREQSEFMERYGCAEIVDLWVAPRARRRGVGRALMRHAEAVTRAAGIGRLGLATGGDDGYTAARALYADLGYRDTRCGPFIESWAWRDDAGVRVPAGEILIGYFVKDL